MSENLIYGADIQKYGAVADGKCDCSIALKNALENGENLISFPFGTYLFTQSVVLKSNTKLHFHPSANIIFAPTDENCKNFLSASHSSCIEICGGLFNIKAGIKCNVFEFEECENIRISSCTINTPDCIGSILLNGCEYVVINNVIFNGKSDALVVLNECSSITFKNNTVKACCNVIQCGKQNIPCKTACLDIRNINVLFCDSFIELLCGSIDVLSVENITARFSFAFFKLFDAFSLVDASLESIDAYIIDRGTNSGKNPCYFAFAAIPGGFEMRNFKRNTELESTPFVPTVLLKNTCCDNAKLIIDGIALDNVINARGKSKTVAMTTAKLTNPYGKFIYTLEISVAKDDSLNIPYGDFDYISIDRF